MTEIISVKEICSAYIYNIYELALDVHAKFEFIIGKDVIFFFRC